MFPLKDLYFDFSNESHAAHVPSKALPTVSLKKKKKSNKAEAELRPGWHWNDLAHGSPGWILFWKLPDNSAFRAPRQPQAERESQTNKHVDLKIYKVKFKKTASKEF